MALMMLAVPSPTRADQWQEMEDSFERGADQARYWQWGWGAFYAGSSAWSLVQAHRTHHADDRYDDYVDATKAALGLAGTLLFAPRHGQALQRFQALRADGDRQALASARIVMATLAAEEEQQRRWRSRLGGLIVNGLAGLAIGLDDNRPGDAWVNFATGMLTTELNVRTRPDTATAFLEQHPDFTVKANGGRLDFYVQRWVTPMGAGVAVRF
ncbi:hypothetical protein CEK62_06060 [Alcanivorax sp. N3-2A]|nr:hypothetical protein CEK62_06060 [Alcanivorax sp. N3-2A]